jgi:hypothetical protein
MDTLHNVMRSLRGETKKSRDHLSVFREFLGHLDRITRARAVRGRPSVPTRSSGHGKSTAARRNGKG